jgi:soluble lytic murein transglycosylase
MAGIGLGSGFYDAMERQESGGNPSAVSPKGALGVMQVMPGTARDVLHAMGRHDIAALSDKELRQVLLTQPELNREIGRRYLHRQMDTYKSPDLALAAYNAGPGRVNQWLEQIGDPRQGEIAIDEFVRRIPYRETRDYVTKLAPRQEAPVPAANPRVAPVSGHETPLPRDDWHGRMLALLGGLGPALKGQA